MNRAEREALESAGFRVGTAAEFLGMDEADRKYVEFRLAIVRAVYKLRTAQKLSQQALAERIGSSQPRVARIEAGAPGVSLDLAAKALFALGGGLDDLKPVTARDIPARPRKGARGRVVTTKPAIPEKGFKPAATSKPRAKGPTAPKAKVSGRVKAKA